MKNKAKPISRQKKLTKTVSKKMQSPKNINKRKPLNTLYWQSSLDAVTDAVCFLDADHRILHCNRAMSEMFGLSQKELSGHYCWEIIHANKKQVSKCPAERSKNSLVREKTEIRMGEKWFRIIADPILDKKGIIKGMVHTLQDITEHKHTTQSMQETEKKYRDLLENASEVIFSVDPQGRITYISPAMEHLTGYSTDEVIGTNMSDHIMPEDLPDVLQRFKQMLNRRKRETFQYRVKIKNGGIRYVVSSSNVIQKDGKPVSIIGVITDITERKKAEEALQAAELKFRNIFESASDGILLADFNNKNFISANDSICFMLGYTKEELLRLNVSDIHPKDSLTYVIDQFERLAKKEITIVHDIPMMRKDKTVFFADVNSSSIILEGKECLMGIFRDITERKQLEKVLKERDIVFRKLSTNVPGIIYQFMMKPDGTYCVPFSTEAVKEIYGCSPEDIVNDFSPIAKVVHPEDVERFIDSIKLSAKNMSQWRCEYRIQVPGKPLRWLFGTSTPEKLPDGSIIWHGFNAEITEQKEAQDNLKISQDNYRRLFEDHSAVKLLIDPETGMILDANQAAADFYGWTREEIKQMKIWQINTLSQEEVKKEMDKALLERRVHFEFRHRRADDSIRDVEVFSSKIKINGKDVLHSIIHDITERKKVEEELLLINKAVEGSSDAIGISDPQGRHFYQNKAFSDLFGYSNAEELQTAGGGPAAFADREIASEVFNSIMSGKSWQGEIEMISKSRRIFPVLIRADAIKDATGKIIGLIGIHTDITERKRAEEALKRSEEDFRSLFEQSIDGIIINDQSSIIEANHAFCVMSGYPIEKIVGKNPFDFIHPDDRAVAAQRLEQRLKGTPSFEGYIYRAIRADGSISLIDLRSKLIEWKGKPAFLTIISDISEQRQAQDALRASEEKYRGIFDESIITIYVFDIKKNFIDSNQAGLDLLGYTREELMKMSIPDVDADPVSVLPAHQELFDGGRLINYEHRLRRKDGSIITVLNNSRPLTDNKGKPIGMLSTLLDITERRHAEEALRESETKLRAVIQGSPVPQFVIDQNHKILYWNKALEDISGIKSASVLGTNRQWQAFYPKERPCLADLLVDEKIYLISEFYKGKYNESRFLEGVYEAKDFFPAMGKKGKWLFFSAAPIRDARGNIIGAVETLEDITERENAEAALQSEFARLKTMVSNAPVVIFAVDKEGVFTLSEGKALTSMGLKGGEVVGRSAFDVYRDTPEDQEHFRRALNGETFIAPVQVGDHSFEAYHTPILGKDGKFDGSSGILVDVTERKKAEEELGKHRQHLEELVRERTIHLEASNKELEAFSYSASHDLRAPLRSIEGFSQALLEDYEHKFDAQGKDYLSRIKLATRRMADLIEDMLQLSRITRMEMNIEKVDLTTIARSLINELQKSHPERNVKVKISEGLEDKADLRLTRIILDNLLRNAWKFTEKQPKATIEVGLWKMEDGKKTYFIRDNGAGFDMAYADKLFAPFQRLHADDEFPGTGIGLATVRRILNRHGGKIWAEGETGKGATFYFNFSEK